LVKGYPNIKLLYGNGQDKNDTVGEIRLKADGRAKLPLSRFPAVVII
jgi:hypothetical protein